MIIEESLKLIVKNISEGVITIDNKGNIVIINKIAEDLLCISAKDCIGKSLKEVIPKTHLLKILKTKKNESNERFFLNGREFITNRIPIMLNNVEEGAIAIFQDINIYKKMKNEMSDDKLNVDILNTVINTINECVVVINEKGIITMMSKAYKEFLNCSNPEGKQVIDVIENTRLHKVLETGIMEVGDLQEISGNKMVSMRMPIKKDGKIVGVIGKVMFKSIGDLHSLNKKLNNLEKEVEFYKNVFNTEKVAKYSFEDIVGSSPIVKKVKGLAKKAGNTNSNVLIVGESGTGKELYAHAIHNSSKRVLGPFVEINCAAIPQELLEAELFGYEEGAFTGAKKGGKKGKFEIANGGTIFLDEIGDMPMNMQVKILRVIQEKEIERVGGNVVEQVDVRIIAATNKNLEEAVRDGKFRADLYYRLNVIKISLPALRERKEDIPQLANALRIKVSNRLGMYVEGISKEAIECLANYNWPGNIRELENVIERAINLLDSDLVIQPEHLPERLRKNKFKSYIKENKYLKDIIESVEKDVILECLNKTKWNKNKTSQLLGISRAGLYKKIEEYKLSNV
ncbi:sigma 54-interacting transcriptional regulator [Clostridium sp. P21]|uniref:Sigma 54-interacting transcriptional regulator n=1 Tax=Clostridium muellerianum TaxID=2716538 RepID=A0A7Y0HNQ4_9CLOT|nr:sigma 54-interacting transcriptional regulator [Clostridium muellerianum]NMM62897.1 sigma 54-interacting transcriptional regulator [Clostridium muellerianum]